MGGEKPKSEGKGGHLGLWGHPSKPGIWPFGIITGAPLSQEDPDMNDLAE
jgi:hypothetical protein